MGCTKCKDSGFDATTQTHSTKNNINKKLIDLYHAVNQLMCRLGAEGVVNAHQNEVCVVMSALAEIDGGTYDDKFVGS